MREISRATDAMLSVLKSHSLFSGCAEAVLVNMLLPGCRVVTYGSGEAIRQYDDPPVLCLLMTGSASVLTLGEGSDCLLSVLHPGDAFGAATLFAGVPAVTRIVAEQPTRVLIAEETYVRSLLMNDPTFAMNYVGFLSDRVRFLNRRLACFGAGTAIRRLAAWLDASVPEGVSDFTLPLSLTRLPDALGVSRASLYRAMDELEESGYMIRHGKHIILPDRDGFRRAFGLA